MDFFHQEYVSPAATPTHEASSPLSTEDASSCGSVSSFRVAQV